jgi:hypothetical protein
LEKQQSESQPMHPRQMSETTATRYNFRYTAELTRFAFQAN